MNYIKLLITAGIVLGIVSMVGFGIYMTYEYLLAQWNLLNQEWHAVISLFTFIFLFFTLIILSGLKNIIKKQAVRGAGKVMAYNEYISWYLSIFKNKEKELDIDSIVQMLNQLQFWGNKNMTNNIENLVQYLKQEKVSREHVLELSDKLYQLLCADMGESVETM